MVTALRTAFDAILAASSDQARAKALRAGLKCLLSEEPARDRGNKALRHADLQSSRAKSGTAANGSDTPKPRRSHKPSGRRRGRPPKPTTGLSPVSPEPVPAALSDTEREQLRFLASTHAAMPGLDAELVERAIAGAELVPSHASKVRAVLIAG